MIPKVKKHGRIKEKYNPDPNAAQRRYHDHERDKGCLVCGRPPSIHHVTTRGAGRMSKNHWLVSPLCPEHHQGPTGIHMLGHFPFIAMHHIDLFDEAINSLKEYCDSQGLDFPDSLAQYDSMD